MRTGVYNHPSISASAYDMKLKFAPGTTTCEVMTIGDDDVWLVGSHDWCMIYRLDNNFWWHHQNQLLLSRRYALRKLQGQSISVTCKTKKSF